MLWYTTGLHLKLFLIQVRQRIADFGVLLAIVAMVLVDYFVGLDTPKLTVPEKFQVKSMKYWTLIYANNLYKYCYL